VRYSQTAARRLNVAHEVDRENSGVGTCCGYCRHGGSRSLRLDRNEIRNILELMVASALTLPAGRSPGLRRSLDLESEVSQAVRLSRTIVAPQMWSLPENGARRRVPSRFALPLGEELALAKARHRMSLVVPPSSPVADPGRMFLRNIGSRPVSTLPNKKGRTHGPTLHV
jgi:hypothetical protein